LADEIGKPFETVSPVTVTESHRAEATVLMKKNETKLTTAFVPDSLSYIAVQMAHG
jgi:hypothetical protein